MTRAAALPLFPVKGRPRPARQVKAPVPPERSIQKAIADLLRWQAAPGWIWSANASGAWHSFNDETAARIGRFLREQGVQVGWPDLELVSPESRWHGLELKSRTGRLSVAQKAFRANCDAYGRPYAIARSVDEAREILAAWGALRCSDHIPTTSSAA